MTMEQVPTLLMLLMLLALACSPAVYDWARRRDAQDWEPMSGRQAAARHLYGESVGWDWAAMDDYDTSPALQVEYLQHVAARLQRR